MKYFLQFNDASINIIAARGVEAEKVVRELLGYANSGGQFGYTTVEYDDTAALVQAVRRSLVWPHKVQAVQRWLKSGHVVVELANEWYIMFADKLRECADEKNKEQAAELIDELMADGADFGYYVSE